MPRFMMEMLVDLADELPDDVKRNATLGMGDVVRAYLGRVDSGRPGVTRLVSTNVRPAWDREQDQPPPSPAVAILSAALDQARQGYPIDFDVLADEMNDEGCTPGGWAKSPT